MGKVIEGTIVAENEAGVASALRQKRLEVVSASPGRWIGFNLGTL